MIVALRWRLLLALLGAALLLPGCAGQWQGRADAGVITAANPAPVRFHPLPDTGSGPTPEQDLLAIRRQAEAGDANAQLLLAEQLLAGANRDLPQAIQWLEQSAAQDHAPAQDLLASLYYRGVGVTRDYARARTLFEQAVGHSYLPAINNLAWLLATCPNERLRDGKRAVALLLPALDQSVQMLDTLAAAHAEAGAFADAIRLQQRAIAGLGSNADPRLPAFAQRLQSYAAGKAWRDPRPEQP